MTSSIHVDGSALMAASINRTTVQPFERRYPSLRRSLACWRSLPCQYAPSASMTTLASGNARSTLYGPMAYSAWKGIPRAINSFWSAVSRLLVRGHMLLTQDPAHRREQNLKRESSAFFTHTIRPHISQARCSRVNSQWSGPVTLRRWACLQASEQNRLRPTRDGWSSIGIRQVSQATVTRGFALCAGRPRFASTARFRFSRDLGFGRPECVALATQAREQKRPRPRAISRSAAMNTDPQWPQETLTFMRKIIPVVGHATNVAIWKSA